MRTQDFNEVRQFAYVLGAEGERVLIKPINYRIQYQGGNYSSYSHGVPQKKKKTNNSKFGSETNSDTLRIRSETLAVGSPRGLLTVL